MPGSERSAVELPDSHPMEEEVDQAFLEGIEITAELVGCAAVDDLPLRDHADLGRSLRSRW